MTDSSAISWPEAGPVPPSMRAVTFSEFGGPEVLTLGEVETPEPQAGEVLVRVAAVAVGRTLDLAARAGLEPFASAVTLPHILGAEHAGTVAAVGEGVTGLALGDHVATFPVYNAFEDEYTRSGHSEVSPGVRMIGTHRPGAYAQYVAVPASNVRIVPADVDPAEAVAVILAGAVAMNQFVRVGGIHEGSRVVVPGATSALGSTTALLAKHLGATVVVTSRDEAKRARLRELGFEHVLSTHDEDFADQVRTAFGGLGAQLIVDNLGLEETWRRCFDALAPGGTVVTSGAFLGLEVPINVRRLYLLSQRVVGVRTGNLASVDLAWAELSAGFRAQIDRTFPLEDAAHAHRYVASSENVGRVILTIG
ncbi:zinc-binding alcohol dehydrogenase family protein [uncultured Microbacterium sp.]|uniref:quinone oxidoreductase family protein n=1 Tax=uncultured Microbacterium sp. TaxID=191216 RepID=UPI0035CC4695